MPDQNGSLKIVTDGVRATIYNGRMVKKKTLGTVGKDGFNYYEHAKFTPSGYVLTSGQVAKALAVAPRTVSKWCDKGYLPHYRIPGSNDRRVYAHVLLKFIRDNGMNPPASLVALLEGKAELVTVGVGGIVHTLLKGSTPGYADKELENLFDAGAYLSDPNRHGVIVVGPELTSAEASLVADRTRDRWVVLRFLAADQQDAIGVEANVRDHETGRLCALVNHYLTTAK